MSIPGLASTLPALPTIEAPPAAAADSANPAGFGDALRQLLNTVDDKAGAANQAVGRMLDGTGDVHEAMIAMQQADTMLQLTVQIRNKLVQAYQDVMRMPV
jgi:flagellar hook-basal body complex protein FliE